MRFAYADPPYPGLAKRYYGNSAQEVNHRLLIGTLEKDYPNGWALSTSASALAEVLSLCPPGARVCAWVRGSRSSVSYRPRTAWEPLIVVGGRSRPYPVDETSDDVLIWGGRQHSHPGALVGMKSAAFCEWMFRMLGAERGDSMDDIFPGSGSVTRAWNLYGSDAAASDTSLERVATSRLEEAQSRLAEQLDRRPPGTDATRNLEASATSPELSSKYSSTHRFSVFVAVNGEISVALTEGSSVSPDIIELIRIRIVVEYAKRKADRSTLAEAGARAAQIFEELKCLERIEWRASEWHLNE